MAYTAMGKGRAPAPSHTAPLGMIRGSPCYQDFRKKIIVLSFILELKIKQF